MIKPKIRVQLNNILLKIEVECNLDAFYEVVKSCSNGEMPKADAIPYIAKHLNLSIKSVNEIVDELMVTGNLTYSYIGASKVLMVTDHKETTDEEFIKALLESRASQSPIKDYLNYEPANLIRAIDSTYNKQAEQNLLKIKEDEKIGNCIIMILTVLNGWVPQTDIIDLVKVKIGLSSRHKVMRTLNNLNVMGMVNTKGKRGCKATGISYQLVKGVNHGDYKRNM